MKPQPSLVRAREPQSQYPTTSQATVLKAFAKLCDKLGRAPSLRELSKVLEMSEVGCRSHIVQLTLKGYLKDIKELKVVDRELTPLAKQFLKNS